ncbi:MAG: hypothetical protein A2Y12_09300 [Planctomycetes bacterium GWF2_42_9]|nr:MAG: hypothetical protein A2Y12_09300 [Planctomycetes bacterium GWF2_42_9]
MTDMSDWGDWIWPAQYKDEINYYVEFRHEFDVQDIPGDAQLKISVDSNYVVWLNGNFVNTGQFTDFPENKTFDSLPVSEKLRTGKNILAILVFYCGENHFSYIKGQPGLIYSLSLPNLRIVSGEETCYRKSPCYKSGPVARITPQLPFTFEYNAAVEDDWQQINCNADDWKSIKQTDCTSVEFIRSLESRPVQKSQIKQRSTAAVIAQGLISRIKGQESTIAEMMQIDYLSSRKIEEVFINSCKAPIELKRPLTIRCIKDGADGVYLILDLGREEVGFFELEIEANAGTVVEFSFGEHLDDMRVRAAVGARNFASRYICKDGIQKFTHFANRIAGRYIQLAITQLRGEIILYYASLVPVEYPIDVLGAFHSYDGLENKIYETSVRTLHLCMHEHYEDCVWREQALYANDARNQALSGYYCFGEYKFPQVSFSLLGQSIRADGFLELCAPAKIPITIPSFSLCWILAVRDNLLYSGDLGFSKKMLPVIKQMINSYLGSVSDNLLSSPEGEGYWHNYEWAPGLDGTVGGDCTKFEVLRKQRFDAPLNFLFVMALDAAANLAFECGDTQYSAEVETLAQNIREACNKKFWNNQLQLYCTFSDKPHFAELTQALAICSNTCSDEVAKILISQIMNENNTLVKTTLSQSLYKFQAVLHQRPGYGNWVFERIAKDWGGMLFKGATTFWETINGGWDFDNAGSLCHGWSAIPAYFYHAYKFGVRPLTKGFERFLVDPVEIVCTNLSGIVPTPSGPIELQWQWTSRGLLCCISFPKQLHPTLSPKFKDIDVDLIAK